MDFTLSTITKMSNWVISSPPPPTSEYSFNWWFELYIEAVIVFFVVTLCIYSGLIAPRTVRRFSFWFYVLCVISLLSEYFRLRKERWGTREAHLKKLAHSCYQYGLLNRVISTVSSWLRWSESDCDKYYEASYGPGYFEISPFEVIVGAVFRPLRYLLKLISVSFMECAGVVMSSTPPLFQPFAFIALILCCFLSLFLFFGYEIHFPFVQIRSGPRRSRSLHVQKR